MLDNPQATKEALIQWIRDYFSQNGPSCSAVVGISGGKDSTIVAALCKEAPWGRTRSGSAHAKRHSIRYR